jgi:hypothetical protein
MITLNQVLDKYPYFSLAKNSDNNEIIHFFKTMKMETKSISLRYDRGDDFFAFNKIQGDRYFVFLMRDENKVIKGTAVISVIPHYIDGTNVLCAYLGDLRISPLLNARIRLQWKNCYAEILELFNLIEEFEGIQYLYTAILSENESAIKSLVKNKGQFLYHQVSEYETYNIYSKKPFSLNKFSKLKIANGLDSNLKQFFENTSKCSGVQFDLIDELKRQLDSWPDFKESTFFSIRDENNNILMSFAPWSCPSKKLVIEKMNLSKRILGFLTPLFGIPQIREKEELKILYLTHLVFKENINAEIKKECLTLAINYLLKEKSRKFHFISFFNFKEWNIDSLPFFYEKTEGKYFQVLSKNQLDSNNFINLHQKAPAFEIGTA